MVSLQVWNEQIGILTSSQFEINLVRMCMLRQGRERVCFPLKDLRSFTWSILQEQGITRLRFEASSSSFSQEFNFAVIRVWYKESLTRNLKLQLLSFVTVSWYKLYPIFQQLIKRGGYRLVPITNPLHLLHFQVAYLLIKTASVENRHTAQNTNC